MARSIKLFYIDAVYIYMECGGTTQIIILGSSNYFFFLSSSSFLIYCLEGKLVTLICYLIQAVDDGCTNYITQSRFLQLSFLGVWKRIGPDKVHYY